MSRSRKRRPKADHRRIVAVLCGLLGVAAAALAFAVEHYGGQGVLPTWGQLYDMLGVADNAPRRRDRCIRPDQRDVSGRGAGGFGC